MAESITGTPVSAPSKIATTARARALAGAAAISLHGDQSSNRRQLAHRVSKSATNRYS